MNIVLLVPQLITLLVISYGGKKCLDNTVFILFII